MIKITAALIISLFCSSCVIAKVNNSTALLPRSVTQNYGIYIGKDITVQGYLRYGDDARGLWTSRQTYLKARNGDSGADDAIWSNCIALNADAQFVPRLKAMNDRQVTLSGVVLIERHPLDDVFSFSCNDVTLKVGKIVSGK
jgi:hypothetical protein